MNKKGFMVFVFCLSVSLAQAQNKIGYSISTNVYFSASKESYKTYTSKDQNFTLQHLSSKPYDNPNFSLNASALYPVIDYISIGIQSGIRLFINETHFLNTKRTYLAIPLQAMIDLSLPSKKNNSFGINMATGFLFYKVDDFIYEVKNAFVFDGEVYYKFKNRSSVKVGIDLVREYASFDFKLTGTNTSEVYSFPLKRTSFYVGYGYFINKK